MSLRLCRRGLSQWWGRIQKIGGATGIDGAVFPKDSELEGQGEGVREPCPLFHRNKVFGKSVWWGPRRWERMVTGCGDLRGLGGHPARVQWR